MASNTYVALSTHTIPSATSSYTFTSIPSGYTDLVLVMNAATTHSLSTFVSMLFNSDTGTNYSISELYGTGSSALATRASNTNVAWLGLDVSISNTLGESVITTNLMNYANTSVFKTWLGRVNRASSSLDYQGTNVVCGAWRNTDAISSITIQNTRGGTAYNFAAGSTFSLYGIAAASVGAKATGGTIYSDSQYYYHVFGSTAAFTPSQALTADILTVAGGGGSGYAYGGGGGAGGLLYSASQSLSSGVAYTCTVGAGGNNGTNGSRVGVQGSNSTITGSGFTTLTAIGGGGGGANSGGNQPPTSGGSGGGASVDGSSNVSGGTATSGQGYAGGAGTSGNTGGSGGGGAGAVGTPVVGNQTGANGGIGSSTYSSWGTVTGAGVLSSGTYYLAGGGAGSGGTGGLGGGANPAGSGTANTGGGGGSDAGSGAGGSGIVIIRYAK